VRLREIRFQPDGFFENRFGVGRMAEFQENRTQQSKHVYIVRMIFQVGTAHRFRMLDLTGVDQTENIVDRTA